jgi:multidrug efflux pump
MGGIVGRLFREFAVTLSAAILVSMVISLTTTPMMCAYLLKYERPRQHGRIYLASEHVFSWLLSLYRRSLTWVLVNPTITLVVLLLTIALNVVLVIKMPKGFFPQQDTGVIVGAVQGSQDSSFQAMNHGLQEIAEAIKSDPGVANVVEGTGGSGATNTAFIYMTLKPLAERKVSAAEIINRLRPKLNRLPVPSVFLQPAQDIRIGGRSSNALYQYTLQSDDAKELAHWGPILLNAMRRLPDLRDVNSDQQNGGRDQYLTYDRVRAAKLGLTAQSLDTALYNAFGQAEVSVIRTQLNQYYVVLEVAPQYWQTPEGLKYVYLTSPDYGRIPLFTVAKTQGNTIPLAINHTGLFPSVTVSFNLAPNVSLSDASARIAQMQKQLGAPATLRSFFSGTMQAYQESLTTMPILVVTALIAVYIVLGILYENLVHPITIISTLPSAGVGAMLALTLFNQDLNVISIIGIVLLIGIVKKNAIMMIDFALQAERQEGKGSADAIFEACVLRFRPILMTTMAALFGALPLALGRGTGSELRQPLGISIVGGLIVSQLLTLYTTPVIYLVFDRLRLRIRGEKLDVFHQGEESQIS